MKQTALIALLTLLAFSVTATATATPSEEGVSAATVMTAPPTDSGVTVASFKALPNDVSAFISPVRDLNGEACALVKVVAPSEFAFSTPLGIVKREDKTGEIWLWLPQGTKTLTIKHPQWGVIRDYKLPDKLESRMTYEMRLTLPLQQLAAVHDTITLTKTITDTIKVVTPVPRVRLATHLLLTTALHTDGPSWGIMAMMVWRHGFYIHASSDLHSTGSTKLTCDKDGYTDGNTLPYYSGHTRHSNYTITAGAAHRLTKSLCLFEGMGYGRTATAWQLAESEGGGYALNDGLTHKGISGEAGLLYSYKRLSVAASVITIVGKQWQGSIGVGIKLGKR